MLDREGGGAFDEYAEDVEEWWTAGHSLGMDTVSA